MTRSEEVAAKLDTLRAWPDHSDLDAVLLSDQGGVGWTTAGGDNPVTLGEVGGRSAHHRARPRGPDPERGVASREVQVQGLGQAVERPALLRR